MDSVPVPADRRDREDAREDTYGGHPTSELRVFGWQSWVMLAVSLSIVFLVTWGTRSSVRHEALQVFHSARNEIHAKILYRLSEHARVLWSGAAFIATSENVGREDWKAFVERQRLEQQLPGVQGFGFALLIPREKLASHTLEIRGQGFPDYQVKPVGDREVYSSIIYLEPFRGRNLRAFGYDMFSEPVRREAMARARDTDAIALSGKVVLVQETEADVQAGTLMYTPVYRNNAPRETREQRREALVGWVYSPYRMKDLIQGIQGLQALANENRVHFHIHDGEHLATETLLYDSHSVLDCGPEGGFEMSENMPIEFGGRRWTIEFSPIPGSPVIDFRVAGVFVVGCFVTMLLFALSHSMLAIRYRDGQMAEQRATSRYARSLIEASLDPMMTISADGRITDTNAATEQVTGVSRVQLIGSHFMLYFSEPDRAQAGYQQVFGQGKVTNYPLTIRHVAGTLCEVMFNATLYLDEWGNVAGIFAVARDITEYKRAEEALRESETKFRTIIEFSPVPKFLHDDAQNITFLNKAFVNLFGYTREDIPTLTDWWMKACPGPEYRQWVATAWQGRLGKARQAGTAFEPVELLIRCKDGMIRTVMGSAAGLGESFAGALLVILYDITERKRGEQMEQSLKEKETLLREIHHRVKNNLAVVSSLLGLQAKNKDPGVRALFEDSQQRVKSMALVHEKLYQTRDVSAIDFEDYIKAIVAEIISLYRVDTRVITTEISIENVELDLEMAIPCGLLINELLTNAFKYAFPDNRNGRLLIRFTRVEGIYTLTIKDNGVGLPAGFAERESSTLGLELVNVLAGQLGGSLRITSDHGTEATVTFKARRR